jgi:hypothetical protein
MQQLRAHLRIHAIVLAVAIVAILGVCAGIEPGTFARIFFGAAAVAACAFLVAEYREENRLAESHLVVEGAVIEVTRGRRGHRHVRYEFLAGNGKRYEGKSGWDDLRVAVPDQVWVVYRPDDPAVNKALGRFLFYAFRLEFAQQ